MKKKTSYKIDSGVPVYLRNRSRKKYPFDEMKIGESFVGDKRARRAALAYNHKAGKKQFITRAEAHDRFRIWRVKGNQA